MSLLQSLVDAVVQAGPTHAERVAAVRAAIIDARLDTGHLLRTSRVIEGHAAAVDFVRLKGAAQLALGTLGAEADRGIAAADRPSPATLAALGAVLEVVGAVLDQAAEDNAVPCPECGHPLEAHNRLGCQVAGQKCRCLQRPLGYDIVAERRRHGLPTYFNRWDYRPRPRRRRRDVPPDVNDADP